MGCLLQFMNTDPMWLHLNLAEVYHRQVGMEIQLFYIFNSFPNSLSTGTNHASFYLSTFIANS